MTEIINKLRDSLFKEYKEAMVYIEVQGNDGTISIRSGFYLYELLEQLL